MLTARQNMDEVIKGGNPDHFVNQYEALHFLFNPIMMHSPSPQKGELNVKNAWGITFSYPEEEPGAFPVHKPETIVIQDIESWQDYVHAPDIGPDTIPDAEWDQWKEMYDAVDTTKSYKTTFIAPGVFEQCHHLGEMVRTMENLIMYEDEMHDLIKYITEFELKQADLVCSKLHPEICFHHDDWGGSNTTFMSVGMFEDFFVEPYKEIYGFYHDHGCKYVFHHSDSYAATLVPDMIEMGIDVWQGCFSTNNIPELIKQTEGKITFMGDIENKLVDFAGWTPENNREQVRKAIDECGNKYFIPCIAQGGPGSVFPGVYASMCEEIDKYSIEKYGVTQEDLDNSRGEMQILF